MKDFFSGLLEQLSTEQPKIESLEDLKNQPKQFFSAAGADIVAKIMAELAAGLQGKGLNPTDFDHVMGISARADEIGLLMVEGSVQISKVVEALNSDLAANGVDSMVGESEQDVPVLHIPLDPSDMFLLFSFEANKTKLATAMQPYWEVSKSIFSLESITSFCLNPSFPYEQKITLLTSEIDGIKTALGLTSVAMESIQKTAVDGSVITKEIIAKHLQDGVDIPENLASFNDRISGATDFITEKQNDFLERFSKLLNLKAQVIAAQK